MKNKSLKFKAFLALTGVLVSGLLIFQLTMVQGAASPEPGSDADPVVTKSYVDASVASLNSKITQLTNGLKGITTSIDELTKSQKSLRSLITGVEEDYNTVQQSVYASEKQNKAISDTVNAIKTQIDSVNKKIAELYTKIGQTAPTASTEPSASNQGGNVSTPTPTTAANTDSSAFKFRTVNLKAGKRLIGSASTEIILRIGKATALGGTKYGVVDIVSGKDLKTGASIVLNHLILVPIDDNRGIRAVTDCTLLVRGTYKVN